MISKKYKQQREAYVFDNLPGNNDYNQGKTVLSARLFDIGPPKMIKLVC